VENKVIAFNPQRPRIEIIAIPLAGNQIPQTFLRDLIGKIFPVERFVESHKDYWGHSHYEYWVAKEAAYQVLLRHSVSAAKFLRYNPELFPELFLRFEEKVCRLIGRLNKLSVCGQQTGCGCK